MANRRLVRLMFSRGRRVLVPMLALACLGFPACASAPAKPTQKVAYYGVRVLQTANQLAQTAAGLADAKVIPVATAANVVIACDALDTQGQKLATALTAVDAAADAASKTGSIQNARDALLKMRAIIAGLQISVPSGPGQPVLDLLNQLVTVLLQIDTSLTGLASTAEVPHARVA